MTWDCILPLSQIRRVRTATLVTLRVVLEITRLLQRRSGPDKRFSIISWSLSARDESVTGSRIYNRLHGDQHRPVFPDICKACVEKWGSGRAHLGIKVWSMLSAVVRQARPSRFRLAYRYLRPRVPLDTSGHLKNRTRHSFWIR